MSTNVVLHACAAGGGRLRVWLGARDCSPAPVLSWTLDQQPVQPAIVRPFQCVRSGVFLGEDKARVFVGLYELAVPSNASRPFLVGVSLDGAPAVTSLLRALPTTVPTGLDGSFQVMLASCFYWGEDKLRVSASLESVLRGSTPDLLLLAGDQVYLDLPPVVNLPGEPAALARKFEQDYVRNWFEDSGYAKVIHSAPYACVPDDHDYWNNYPVPSPQSMNTWSASGRQTWEQAARMLYGHFQHVAPTPVGTPVQFDVDPLSFFLLDARSWRDPGFRTTMTPEARDALEAWVSRCIQERKLGVFMTGQSLPLAKVGGLETRIGDASMSNYGDYSFIMGQLDRLMREAGDVLLLTGDLHWGRVAQLVPKDALASKMQMVEVISSPTSLVTTPVQDQLSQLKARKGDPWPRHSDATLLGGVVNMAGTRSPFFAFTLHRQRGNHVCVLSFRRRGDSLEVTPRYFPLLPNAQPSVASTFVLSHR
jgi:hypothetical protein